MNDGDPGEIVYTSLDWGGTNLIRYRTGDLCDGLIWDKAENGMTVPRISSRIRRVSRQKEFQFTKVKGEMIDMYYFDDLSKHSKLVDWQVELTKKSKLGVDDLIIYIALNNKKAYQCIQFINVFKESTFGKGFR